MANKRKFTEKQVANLGMEKKPDGSYDYLNPSDPKKIKKDAMKIGTIS